MMKIKLNDKEIELREDLTLADLPKIGLPPGDLKADAAPLDRTDDPRIIENLVYIGKVLTYVNKDGINFTKLPLSVLIKQIVPQIGVIMQYLGKQFSGE